MVRRKNNNMTLVWMTVRVKEISTYLCCKDMDTWTRAQYDTTKWNSKMYIQNKSAVTRDPFACLTYVSDTCSIWHDFTFEVFMLPRHSLIIFLYFFLINPFHIFFLILSILFIRQYAISFFSFYMSHIQVAGHGCPSVVFKSLSGRIFVKIECPYSL